MSPRNSKVKVAQNQATMVQGLKEGKKQVAIAAELRLTPETISRNLAKLREGFTTASREEFSVYVKQQVDLLTKAIEEVWQGTLPPEAANSIRGLMDSIARLTGSNAPTKSIVGHVNGPQLDALYLEIRQELLDADDDTKQEALLMVRELVKSRRKPVVVDAMPIRKEITDGVLGTSD
jgi:hypothetical protein